MEGQFYSLFVNNGKSTPHPVLNKWRLLRELVVQAELAQPFSEVGFHENELILRNVGSMCLDLAEQRGCFICCELGWENFVILFPIFLPPPLESVAATHPMCGYNTNLVVLAGNGWDGLICHLSHPSCSLLGHLLKNRLIFQQNCSYLPVTNFILGFFDGKFLQCLVVAKMVQ